MKLCLVAHCNFQGNSAMHVFSLATELTKMGHECVVLVPDSPETVHEHGEPVFEVMDYHNARTNGVAFRDSGGPELVHAWTPREHVRRIAAEIARKYRSRHAVHMEDNETQIVRDELPGLDYSDLVSAPHDLIDKLIGPHRSHPYRSRRFMESAAGYSCLIDRLLEFKPGPVPGVVFWPGFDAPFQNISEEDRAARSKYGLSESDILILYSGNVHPSIARDIEKLYACVGLLRRYGLPVKLIRTGWTYAKLELAENFDLSEYVIDLGFVPRADIPVLVGMSDILVQPGRSDPFNDYRFPSKLPEYLVSGRPVILPDSNIGKALEDGKHVLKLYSGSVSEMLKAILSVVESPSLGRELARNARSFALENLTWARAARTLDGLYRRIKEAPNPMREVGIWDMLEGKCAQPGVSSGAQSGGKQSIVKFPAKLIAFCLPHFQSVRGEASGSPAEFSTRDFREEQAALARMYGIHGFCFPWSLPVGGEAEENPLGAWLSEHGPDFPFCICWSNESWSRVWNGPENTAPAAKSRKWKDEDLFVMQILPILRDPRYIRVDDAPMLLVFPGNDLEDSVGTTQAWRRLAKRNGIDRLHLCAVESGAASRPPPWGFDAVVELWPPPVARASDVASCMPDLKRIPMEHFEDYVSMAMRSINQPPVDYIRYKCACPPADSSSVRGQGEPPFINDSPKAYGYWLRYLVRESMLRRRQQEALVFINAWNEGTRGSPLGPNQKYGRSLLEITYEALCEGIVDHGRGPTPEREREFTARVARLPVV